MKTNIEIIVHVSREYGNLIGVGGMKDSIEGLCKVTANSGIVTHIFLPFLNNTSAIAQFQRYGATLEFEVAMQYHQRYPRTEHVEVSSYKATDRPNLFLHMVNARRFVYLNEGGGVIRRRGVYTYTEEEAIAIGRRELFGEAYTDFFEMDVLLIKVTLRALEHLGLKPDLIRCHDGHTASLPLIAQHSDDAFASYLGHVPTLTTIHNASDWYRGEVPYSDFISALLNVPAYILEICIHKGKFEPFLAAGLFGTGLHTVSENYAREIQETGVDRFNSWLGHKLAAYGIKITGITHGIDLEAFSPKNPQQRGIPYGFSPLDNDFEGKKTCKRELLRELKFENISDDTPLLTFVGRIAYQKGFITLAQAIQQLFAEDQDILLIGNGSGYRQTVEELRTAFGTKFEDRIRIVYNYQPHLSNKILAAGDFCIIPSLFEPCGQIDFIAQLHGNLPIVHAVGGLVKVEHGVTGFSYLGWAKELVAVIKQALEVYRKDKKRLREMQVKAAARIAENFTWEQVFATKYLPLYQEMLRKAKPILPY